MSLEHDIVSQFSTLPDVEGWKNYAFMTLSIVAGTAVIAHNWWKARDAASEFSADYRENEALLDQAVKDHKHQARGKKVVNSTWERMKVSTLLVGGVAAAVGVLALNSHVTVGTKTEGAATVLLDGDNAEIYSHDMNGQSRFQAGVEGLADSGFMGTISIYDVGAEPSPGSNQTNQVTLESNATFSSKLISSISPNQPQLDTNGTNLSQALSSEVSKTGEKLAKDKENVVVYSDGDILDNQTELDLTAYALKEEGVKTKVIVGGTSEGTFSYNGSTPQPAGVQPNVFYQSFGRANVQVADTSSEVAADFKKDMTGSEKSVNEEELWYPAFVIPAAAIGYGLRLLGKKDRGKVVS